MNTLTQKSPQISGGSQPSKLIAYLGALLCFQIMLATLLKVTEPKFQPVEPSAKLIVADLHTANKITIEDGDKSDAKSPYAVLLQKDAQGWKLPEYFGCRAASANVDQIVKTLGSLKKGLPVSTTTGAAERFKVSSTKFKRLITFYKGDQKIAALYVGVSPAFRSAYVKSPDSDNIYTGELSEFELPARPADWVDKGVVQLKESEIQALDFGSFKIQKNGKQWSLEQQGQQHPISTEAAVTVLNNIGNLNVSSVVGEKVSAEYDGSHPALELKASLTNGTTVGYTFLKSKAKDQHNLLLKRSDQPLYYEIGDWVVAPLTQVSPQSLLKKGEEKVESTKTTGSRPKL